MFDTQWMQARQMMKIQDVLNNRSNNFTLLRLLAALAVLFGHSYVLSQGIGGGEDIFSRYFIKIWGESLPSLSVDLFFVTSGFLVTASYIQRKDLIAFMEARILRIYPGIIVAVLLCVFALGPLVTEDSIAHYFSSATTWSYLKHNCLLATGVQFDLPSVFTNNPYPASVNGSLWTLPIELFMYFLVAVLGSLSLLKSETSFNAVFVMSCLMYAQSTNNNFFIIGDPRNAQLALLFFSGAFFYVNAKRIPLSFYGFGVLCALVFLTKGHQFSGFIKSTAFAYTVLLVALHPKLRLPSIDRWGDISYGLYIYAFPVQQMLAHFIPQIKPLIMFALAASITFILATLSWRFIESPALKMKGKIPFGRRTSDIHGHP